MSAIVTVKGRILSESALALHFEQKQGGLYHHAWVPISQCKVITRMAPDRDGSRDAILEIPACLADAKELEVEA